MHLGPASALRLGVIFILLSAIVLVATMWQVGLAIAPEPTVVGYPAPDVSPQLENPSLPASLQAYPGPATPVASLPTLEPTVEPPTPAPTPIPEDVQRALEYVAQRYGTSLAHLHPVYQTPASQPLTGRSYLLVKVDDDTSGQTFGVAVNLETKAVMTIEEMKALEAEARVAKYGKLEPELYDLLQAKGADDEIPVFVWFVSVDFDAIWHKLGEEYPGVDFPHVKPGDSSVVGGNTALAQEIEAEYDRLLTQAHLERERPLAELLRAEGHEVTTYEIAPSIAVTLTKQVILQIAARTDVAGIYRMGKNPIEELSEATPSLHVPSVWQKGYTGSGKKIAITDWGAVEDNNQYIAVAAIRPGTVPDDSHATEVAGCAVSDHPIYRAAAYNATIVSAGVNASTYPATNADWVSAVQWA